MLFRIILLTWHYFTRSWRFPTLRLLSTPIVWRRNTKILVFTFIFTLFPKPNHSILMTVFTFAIRLFFIRLLLLNHKRSLSFLEGWLRRLNAISTNQFLAWISSNWVSCITLWSCLIGSWGITSSLLETLLSLGSELIRPERCLCTGAHGSTALTQLATHCLFFQIGWILTLDFLRPTFALLQAHLGFVLDLQSSDHDAVLYALT